MVDSARDPSGHAGFGVGVHRCADLRVARLESEELLTVLARRVETVEISGSTTRHHNNTLRA